MSEDKNFYIDDDCVVSFWIGELGWFAQRFQGFMRYQKHKVYPDHKFVLFVSPHLHTFVNDFVYATVDLPNWFNELELDTDCYERVLPDSEPGSLTPPPVYVKLLDYCRQHYNKDKAIELWPPRGCNFWVDTQLQVFCKYQSTDKYRFEKPIIVVFPRGRVRAAQRNVPPFVWLDLVEKLRQQYTVVLAGTPSGACLSGYQNDSVINLIDYSESDKTEEVIKYLNSALFSVSSQSGGTHISLLSGCPSYIIGHERDRHTLSENRLNVPTCFRLLSDYRAIDADTMIQDVMPFIQALKESGYSSPTKEPMEIIEDDTKILNDIIKAQRNEE